MFLLTSLQATVPAPQRGKEGDRRRGIHQRRVMIKTTKPCDRKQQRKGEDYWEERSAPGEVKIEMAIGTTGRLTLSQHAFNVKGFSGTYPKPCWQITES